MSLSLRNQRGRIYAYSNTGTDGFLVSTYTFREERWCRFEIPGASEGTLAGKSDARIAGTVAFADEAVITKHDLVVVDGVQYKVVGVKPRRQMREIVCDLVLGDAKPSEIVES